MEDDFETLAIENKQLRKELKNLRQRVNAYESSHWWRAHPRLLFQRAFEQETPPRRKHEGAGGNWNVAAVIQQRRLKVRFDQRNEACEPDEIVVRDGHNLRIHPSTRWSFEQFCYGVRDLVDELDLFLGTTSERKGLLDVGAHHGLFSLLFAAEDPLRRVLAVDASPIAFSTLLYNVHRNGLDNVTPIELALSDEPARLLMHYEWECAIVARGPAAQPTFSARAVPGDSLCHEYSFAPDVLKIDVEGHELQVIRGLRQTIGHQRPLIFLEVHPSMIAADPRGGNLSDLVAELTSLGYRQFQLGESHVRIEEIGRLDDVTRLLLRPA